MPGRSRQVAPARTDAVRRTPEYWHLHQRISFWNCCTGALVSQIVLMWLLAPAVAWRRSGIATTFSGSLAPFKYCHQMRALSLREGVQYRASAPMQSCKCGADLRVLVGGIDDIREVLPFVLLLEAPHAYSATANVIVPRHSLSIHLLLNCLLSTTLLPIIRAIAEPLVRRWPPVNF